MWASGHNGDIRRAAHGYEPTERLQLSVREESVAGMTSRTCLPP
jgi:hypothetical protein